MKTITTTFQTFIVAFLSMLSFSANAQCSVTADWSSYNLGGDSIRFYAADTNTSTAHQYWNFGDGTSVSSVSHPSHHYTAAGTYRVCHYIYIPGETCVDSMCNTVTIAGHSTSCHITANWTSYHIGGDSIRFYTADTNTAAHHIWTFGDGTYAAATTHPTHTYTHSGTYNVCLYVYIPGTSCIDSMCNTVTIVSTADTCALNANWSSYTISGDSLRFYVSETNTAAHYNWVWGDGTYTSNSINTTHTFSAPGTYHVCFYAYVAGTSCTDSLCKNITVGDSSCHISSQWASYSVGGDSVRFYSTDTNTAAHHFWNFGDGTSNTSNVTHTTHQYADTGTYRVCYYVYVPGTNCADSTCNYITVGANDHFQVSALWVSHNVNQDTVAFVATDTTSSAYMIWNFGDNTFAYNTSNPIHVFPTAGTYTVCLKTFIDGTDLSDSLCQEINLSTSGINDVAYSNTKITVVPNPFSQSTVIKAENVSGNTELKLYDILGNLVFSAKSGNSIFGVERSAVSSGVYVFEIAQNGSIIGRGKIVAE